MTNLSDERMAQAPILCRWERTSSGSTLYGPDGRYYAVVSTDQWCGWTSPMLGAVSNIRGTETGPAGEAAAVECLLMCGVRVRVTNPVGGAR